MSNYCESCTNANTPICEHCTYIETSKAILTPSQYCGYDLENANDVCIKDLAALIENRIKNNYPIQLRYVMKYNKLLEERNSGKKKDIHAS